ncbi:MULTISPECIES: FlhC family transcriptional regulator [Morganellaceae]|uniref:Transcriptional regulator n=2 Tax=Morganellaceae TaxID=1903414 RepID=A0A1B8HM70_9GAMM|nr:MULTISPECIES: FlhC family transcriptional regulator [Morganellaceae]OBU10525.1 transcriptional regulator [Morganella psychrotolerans]UNH40593.1 flagellar transcriptional regulator FlhC [Moellerella wisconsensis]UNH44296.1 flagellar transcriptional regulator FlhC [Moellerella wisconsensis]
MKAALVKDEDVFALAQRMVKLGFRRRIITTSLNASDRLIDHLKKQFGQDEVAIGRLKLSETFLASQPKKMEATNFMSIYLRRAKDPSNQDDINEVVDSFEVYRELNIRFRPSIAADVMLHPNEAWTLARDFRSDEIRMIKCIHCKMSFISPFDCDRSNKKQKCPFCEDKAH